MQYVVRPISDRTTFTGKPRSSPFDAPWSRTIALLGAEVRHLRGRDVVMELDVTERDLRLDGMVRANARPASPAVRIAEHVNTDPESLRSLWRAARRAAAAHPDRHDGARTAWDQVEAAAAVLGVDQ